MDNSGRATNDETVIVIGVQDATTIIMSKVLRKQLDDSTLGIEAAIRIAPMAEITLEPEREPKRDKRYWLPKYERARRRR